MDSVLIVAPGEKAVEPLVEILMTNAFSEIETAFSCSEARKVSAARPFDLCIVNTPLPDEFGDGFATDMVLKGIQTILLVRADLYGEVDAKMENAGIFVLPKPLNKGVLLSALKLASAAERQIKLLAEENRKLMGQLDDLRLISRAKCLLVQYLGMTEQTAHKYIEKQAMDMRLTRVAVASNILKTYEN